MGENSACVQKKVLVVDDEYSIREALIMLFTAKGYEVKKADDGLEALNMINMEDFDLIVSDIRMKRMDGVALVRELKEKNKKTPVIFMTAYPEVDNVIEALRCGVVEYIKKPFDMEYMAQRAAAVIMEKTAGSEEHYNKQYRAEKIQFLNRLSHELRTPLTPVAGYLKLLLKKEFGDMSPVQLQILGDMSRNSERLKKTADDLIMLYEMENMKAPLAVKKCKISKIINDVMADLDAVSKSKNLTMDVEIFDSVDAVDCDEKKLKRVFYHVIENAVKFSPEGRVVKITVMKHPAGVKFSVSDTGSGVAGRDTRELFRNFYSVNPCGDDFETGKMLNKGLGLGLTLANAVVEAHGGRIWVEQKSDTKAGETVFSFTLPDAKIG